MLDHGAVVIAAITSCTNTSNPSVMMGAALLARNAVEKGLTRQAVGQDHAGARLEGRHRLLRPGRPDAVPRQAGLQPGRLRLHDLHRQLRSAARRGVGRGQRGRPRRDSVLSGNRNFEGRINPDVKMNYLASPPLVVAYALAGSMDIDIDTEPLGHRRGRQRRLSCRHLAVAAGGPGDHRLGDRQRDVHQGLRRRVHRRRALARTADADRQHLRVGPDSTYVRKPPYFEGMPREPAPVTDIADARVLAKLGDSVTTDHISPAGSIKADSPAAQYLTSTAWSARTSTPTARAEATTR